MPSLFNFSAPIAQQPNDTKTFGKNTATSCRITSSFDITVSNDAYAMLPGTVLLQQQAGVGNEDKVNLILKPDVSSDIKTPVKYIIYRGLDINDFLTSNNVTDPGTNVKTTGLEILTEMKAIQDVRAPGDDITVEALFGDELAPATTKKIDEFFFKKVPISSQLFHVDGGINIGKFAPGEVGIDILLENFEYTPDVEMATSPFFELNTTGLTDVIDLKIRKDLVRHFIDPAAFYGVHIDFPGGIEYRDAGGVKQTADTSLSILNNVLDPFHTRNTVYLDIRNENEYSYNFYNNYVGSGTNADDEIKIGATAGSLAFKEYYPNGWPVFAVDVIAPSSTLTENEFFVALRVNDNERPLVASKFSKVSSFSIEDNGVKFIDESILLSSLAPPLPEFTNAFGVKVPNVIDGGSGVQPASLVQLDYYKQALPITATTKFPRQNFSDYLFGPHNVPIPFDLSNEVQWISSHRRNYVDALNDGRVVGQLNTPIILINVGTQEIVITDEIPVDRTVKVTIENGSIPQNTGDYNIADVTVGGGVTTIKTVEAIPGALQTGDSLVVAAFLEGELDYTNNRFIVRNADYSSASFLTPGSDLDFYSNYSFSNTYEVSLAQFVSPNTEIEFTNAPDRVGYAGIMETGLIFEADSMAGGPFDDDRMVYYAAPKAYFSKDGVRHGFAFADKGGSSDLDSIMDALERMMPGVAIGQTILKPTALVEIVTFSYSSSSKAKEMLYLLGITKTEFQGISTGSLTGHGIMYKLQKVGGRLTDINSEPYYKYELVLCGLDSTFNYTEVNSGIEVFTTDNIIFVSQAFAAKYGIDESIAAQALDDFLTDILNLTNDPMNEGSDLEELIHKSNEEISNLKKGTQNFWNNYTGGEPNKELFELDPTMKTKVTDLKAALDAAPETIIGIEGVIKDKGADLLQHAKARIRMPGEDWTDKDGILYLTRLIMSLVIKNHPVVLAKFPLKYQDFADLFEKHSRGLEGTEKPDFGSFSGYKILISGYDPFGAQAGGAYYDADGHQSNSTGNIALSMDGVTLSTPYGSGTETAMIKSVVFPVRFREFDLDVNGNANTMSTPGWIEEFFKSYVDDQDIDMIVTFSYGIENYKSYDFEIERFAGRTRGVPAGDNDSQTSTKSKYLNDTNKDNFEYLLNKLPIYDMMIKNEVGLDQAFDYEFYNGPIQNSANKVGSSKRVDNPSNNIYDPDLVPFPNYANYQGELGMGLTADRIKSVTGPGGSYLSNEIFYRVAYLREVSVDSSKPTGHIHVGYLQGDKSTNRTKMLTDITESLTKSISSLILRRFMRILNTGYAGNDFFTHINDHTYEEEQQLSTIWQSNGSHAGNKELFELDPTMKDKVLEFKKELDLANDSITFFKAKNIVKDAGADLFKHAKERIIEVGKPYKNKDGILYLTRLIMQVIIKNHLKFVNAFSAAQISELYDLFEKHSRGLEGDEKPNFNPYPNSHKKILISGFDPYGSGFDWQDHNSNSSGNLAMSLDDVEVENVGGTIKGNIRSALVPVRYKEFDNGWIEDFFTPYINDVDLIITFSYGIDTHDFQIDRFASNFRHGNSTDNENLTSYNDTHDNHGLPGDTFIENQLPYEQFAQPNQTIAAGNILTIPSNPCVVGINHRAYWEVFADKITVPTSNDVNITSLHALSKQFIDFTFYGYPVYNFWDNRHVIPVEEIQPFNSTDPGGNSQVDSDLKYKTPGNSEEIKFPLWTNYPDASLTTDYGNFYVKARIGSGQYYHSNEIAYRVSNLRNTIKPTLKSGHIHIGFLTGDPVTDRDDMIAAAKYMIEQMLNAL